MAKDLTTGKDVAYAVRTLAPPAGGATGHASGAFTPGHGSAGPASRSSTPDRFAAAQASGFYRSGGSEGPAGGAPAAGTPAGAADGAGEAAAAAGEARAAAAPPEGSPAVRPQGPAQGLPRRSPHMAQGGHGPYEGSQQGQPFGRTTYEHFGQHRQPSPATQRDWRLPAREAAFAAAQAERAGGHSEPVSRRSSGAGLAGPSPAPSLASSAGGGFAGGEAPAPAAPAPMARYRGTVAQVGGCGGSCRSCTCTCCCCCLRFRQLRAASAAALAGSRNPCPLARPPTLRRLLCPLPAGRCRRCLRAFLLPPLAAAGGARGAAAPAGRRPAAVHR